MQDDVNAVELRKLLDEVCDTARKDSYAAQNEFSCSSEDDRAFQAERDQIDRMEAGVIALQQRCERLEQAARAALPWVVGEEEATALEAALAGTTVELCGKSAPQSGEGAAGQGEATPGERPFAPECAPGR